MSIMQEMGPPELRTHLHLNSQMCTSFLVMRRKVLNVLEAKSGARPHKDHPMDVGNAARTEDKRKRERKQTGMRGKGTGKQHAAAKFKGNCSNPNSWTWTHKWADCWTKKEEGHMHGQAWQEQGTWQERERSGSN